MMRPFGILLVVLLLASASRGAIYGVEADGSGEFPTIQAAIDAATDGDVIELGDGVFRGDGNRDLTYRGKAITVRSRGGAPEGCVIDCEGSVSEPHRGFHFHSGEGPGTVLAGVTIANGHMPAASNEGGGIYCYYGSPTIRECVFLDNRVGGRGGGVQSSGGSPAIVRCRFVGNQAHMGGGIFCWGGRPTVHECVFEQNTGLSGGGMWSLGSQLRVTDCVFRGNLSGSSVAGMINVNGVARITGCLFEGNGDYGSGAGVTCWGGETTIEDCTFYDNGTGVKMEDAAVVTIRRSTFCRNRGSMTVWVGNGCHATIESTIVAFTTTGNGVACGATGTVTLLCCDVYGNLTGDWALCIADQYGISGNICADPLFCDAWSGDLLLDSESPCAAENNPACGRIGAWDVGCGQTPAAATTWGAIKALYR